MNSVRRNTLAMLPVWSVAAALSCSGTDSKNANAGGNARSVGATQPNAGGSQTSDGASTGQAGSSATAGVSADSGGTTGSATGACLAATLLSSLGKSSILIGAQMEDATANLAPFDVRYVYMSGSLFDGSEPCESCLSGCATGGVSCANDTGDCAWWGCWQWDQDPPGQYVVDFVATTGAAIYNKQAHPQIPMITYHHELRGSSASEGVAQIGAMNDQTFLHKYFADYRLLLKKIGSGKVLLHIEPDFWGHAQQSGEDPHQMPAPVTAANPTDCGSMENSVAGVAGCLISMTRKYAANTKVGLHASSWATGIDVFLNMDSSLDVQGEAAKLGKFMLELGAADGDFIVADMSDRDAAFHAANGKDDWWDDTNATLPNFHQAFAWGKSVSDTMGKPIVWWQIPIGNMKQDNTTNHYQDNRVDYLFAHLDEVVAANGAGIFFGAGEGQQTQPETDGGNLVAKVKAVSAPPSPCP